MPLADADAKRLLEIARLSINHGLKEAMPFPVVLPDESPALQEYGASFVTLTLDGKLRGCIGALEARNPLAEDVSEHAFSAAFEDPRFEPVTKDEAAQLEIHLSILTPSVPLPCADEADLLAKLRPGRDGLILQEGRRRATFLPSVWEELPDPREFVAHLKMKAGLNADYWSKALQFSRYEAEPIV